MKPYLYPLLCAAFLGLVPAVYPAETPEGTEVVSVEPGDFSIDPHSKLEATVHVPAIPPGHQAVLEFRAWHQSKVVAGYYRHLKVNWEKTPLTTLLDRPMTIVTVDGLELDTVTETGFLTPLVADPESMRGDTFYMTKYRPNGDEEIDLTLYRFALPDADFPGERKLEILNRISAGQSVTYPVMTIRNVRILFLPKANDF